MVHDLFEAPEICAVEFCEYDPRAIMAAAPSSGERQLLADWSEDGRVPEMLRKRAKEVLAGSPTRCQVDLGIKTLRKSVGR